LPGRVVASFLPSHPGGLEALTVDDTCAGLRVSPEAHPRPPSGAGKAVKELAEEFGSKGPKAAATIADKEEALLAYYDYPAEHWRHLRTTNPIKSPFATVRARTDTAKGPGSREAGVGMIVKLLEAAEGRWRRLNGYRLIPLVRAG
jgi:hypothetical protein